MQAQWDDGNHATLADGKDDPKRIGVDGILGTAPVGSFKPNALWFFDLGGNATEWILDRVDVKDPRARRALRGGDWLSSAFSARSAYSSSPWGAGNNCGFRLAPGRLQVGEAGSR